MSLVKYAEIFDGSLSKIARSKYYIDLKNNTLRSYKK